ncbi:hypothetical protein GQ600_24849 [Phytophthora cactorum]|nr:hypothetical protein GQ600_24849 [Phytophthora cactorum]
MDNYSQSPENGSEEADGELPVVTDGEDVEERIVGPIDTSDWDSTGSATISAAANANIVALKDSNGLHLVDEKEPSARAQAAAKAKARRTEYTPTVTISPFAGYIVFKDKQAAVFYTNDFSSTPPVSALIGDGSRAIACVHGLYPIRRWTGSDIMNRTAFMVPTLVAAYNLAMNTVDRVDQLRITHQQRRKEMRLTMSMPTWALDLCALNAFALVRKVQPAGTASASVCEFKRRIAEALTAPALQQRHHGEACPSESECSHS